MIAFFEFYAAHPLPATSVLICGVIALLVAGRILTFPFATALAAYRLHQRTKNIVAQGWPPAHCDADGDAVETGESK